MKTVLFACIHNAGRSQMAAAFSNQLADGQKAQAISAGTQPGDRVNPEVVAVMKEVGVDLTTAAATGLTSELAQHAISPSARFLEELNRSIDGDVTRARDHLMAPGAKVVEAAGFRTASD